MHYHLPAILKLHPGGSEGSNLKSFKFEYHRRVRDFLQPIVCQVRDEGGGRSWRRGFLITRYNHGWDLRGYASFHGGDGDDMHQRFFS